MDESVKRRERLKAMRSEASSTQDGGVRPHDLGNSASPPPPPLCNPLLNPTPTHPIHGDSNSNSNSTSRFDYYTDPLSAFSGFKRSKQDSQNSSAPPPRPFPPYMPHSPSHQPRPSYSPDFRMPQVHRSSFPPPPPPPQQYGIPPGMRSPYDPPHQGPPGSWNAPLGSPGYHQGPTNYVRSNNSFNPYPAQGRGPWHNRIPYSGTSHKGSHQSPNTGRGQGRYGNFVRPGVGRGRGWTGSHNQSAESAPGLYYDKSSVVDPWKFLTPVRWKGGKGLIVESSRESSMITGSSAAKKPETSSKWSGSGPSLAEFLADSFNEAAVDNKETSKD